MKPTVKLAETTAPNGAQLALFEHDGEYFLQAGAVQLQTSYVHGADDSLARLACAPFRPARQPRLLLGGLGLGFTLAAARAALPQKRGIFVVAEPVGELPGWHREFLEALHPGQLDDARVQFAKESVLDLFKKDQEGFNAILIDAEGSSALSGVTDRDRLPHSSFLDRAHSALKDGGMLAVSCSSNHSSFERRLRQAGFDVACESVPASHKGKQRERYYIWLARKGSYQTHQETRSRSKPK